MMDPLWSETWWSTFKYFIILIVSTCYLIVHKLDNEIFIAYYVIKSILGKKNIEGNLYYFSIQIFIKTH